MLFNIQSDKGDEIIGYVVPDDSEKTPVLRVLSEGSAIAQIPCNELRPALVESGRHSNGLCGFTINSSNVPALAEQRDVEIVDEESGILIYRRKLDTQCVPKRLFRLETHLFPLWKLDSALETHFIYFHKGIERYGRETATQILHLENAPSLYVSGRLAYKQYDALLDKSFYYITLLNEPYYELAERLMTFKHIPKYGDALMGPRDLMTFQPAIDFAATLESDDTVLRRAFANMPGEVIALLSNPLAHQLAAESFDSALPRGAVATALANLSLFTLVGLRERADLFAEDMEIQLNLPDNSIQIPPLMPPVHALANKLRRIPEAELLLEADLDIYAQVKVAIDQAETAP